MHIYHSERSTQKVDVMFLAYKRRSVTNRSTSTFCRFLNDGLAGPVITIYDRVPFKTHTRALWFDELLWRTHAPTVAHIIVTNTQFVLHMNTSS